MYYIKLKGYFFPLFIYLLCNPLLLIYVQFIAFV